jgi:hypothetical protein
MGLETVAGRLSSVIRPRTIYKNIFKFSAL